MKTVYVVSLINYCSQLQQRGNSEEKNNLIKIIISNFSINSFPLQHFASEYRCILIGWLIGRRYLSHSVCSFLQRNFELTCFGSSVLHGFVLWFTVSFPDNVLLSTSPYSQQVFLNLKSLTRPYRRFLPFNRTLFIFPTKGVFE